MKDASHTQIVPYNPAWSQMYEEEAGEIRELLGDKALRIEHIGSTSIPGLSSKPIIDIAVLIENASEADEVVKEMEDKLGYTFDREAHEKMGGTERHFLTKGEPIKYHLSVAYADQGSFFERQLLFRDYLREHDDVRDEYDALKRSLLENDPTGKSGYIGGKTDFVARVLKEAGFKGERIN